MYTQEVKHRVLSEIRNDFPYFKIGIRFNDIFTEDVYFLESSNNKNDLKNIPFAVYKNDELIMECSLINNNTEQLLDEVMVVINDYDLQKIFNENHKSQIQKQLDNFLLHYDKVVLMNEVNLEGELRRMKKMAGITPGLLY